MNKDLGASASQTGLSSLRDEAAKASSPKASIPCGGDDPAYALPMPPIWALDAAARNSGFAEWFAVPAMFRTPTNRAIIVDARKIVAVYGKNELAAECRERASYLKAMEPEGLSTLERQCMDTLFKAASAIEAGTGETRSGSISEADESAAPKEDAQP